MASTIFLSTGTKMCPEDFNVFDNGVHWSFENSLGSTPTFDPTGNVLASHAPWVGVVGIPEEMYY